MAITELGVSRLLSIFQAAWNRGDIVGACEVYADNASFVSESVFIQGKEKIIERYKNAYPDASAMGKLELKILEFRAPEYFISITATAILGWTIIQESGQQHSGFAMEAYELYGNGIFVVQDATIITRP